MARIYSPVGPSSNKAVSPGKEKKAGKAAGAAPDKGDGKAATSTPGDGKDGQESPESAG